MLAERGAETEELRRVPDGVIAEVKAAGLHRVCQPERFGGGELPLNEAVDLIALLARGCASTAG